MIQIRVVTPAQVIAEMSRKPRVAACLAAWVEVIKVATMTGKGRLAEGHMMANKELDERAGNIFVDGLAGSWVIC